MPKGRLQIKSISPAGAKDLTYQISHEHRGNTGMPGVRPSPNNLRDRGERVPKLTSKNHTSGRGNAECYPAKCTCRFMPLPPA
jgi:hypothetical protein